MFYKDNTTRKAIYHLQNRDLQISFSVTCNRGTFQINPSSKVFPTKTNFVKNVILPFHSTLNRSRIWPSSPRRRSSMLRNSDSSHHQINSMLLIGQQHDRI